MRNKQIDKTSLSYIRGRYGVDSEEYKKAKEKRNQQTQTKEKDHDRNE